MHNRTQAGWFVPATDGSVSREWSANSLNQLTAATAGPENGTQFTYDLDGNTLSDGQRTYEWDAESRLVAVNYGGNKRVEWSYDGFNRRVQQRDMDGGGGTTRDLIWDGLSIIESRNQNTGEVRKYYGNGEERITDATNPASTLRLYYTTDHLGSVREMVDSSGAVRASYDYSPDGWRRKVAGDLESEFGFTGHYTHDASGIVLAPYRAYAPEAGRWLSRDPIEEEGGIHLYGYVGNGPVMWTDLLGFKPGDLYPSLDRARMDAARDVYNRTNQTHLEAATILYQDPKTKKYSYTNIADGEEPTEAERRYEDLRGKVSFKTCKIPAGGDRKEFMHSHNVPGGAEEFSGADISAQANWTEDQYCPSNIVTPKGDIIQYNRPKLNREKPGVPYNPRDPSNFTPKGNIFRS